MATKLDWKRKCVRFTELVVAHDEPVPTDYLAPKLFRSWKRRGAMDFTNKLGRLLTAVEVVRRLNPNTRGTPAIYEPGRHAEFVEAMLTQTDEGLPPLSQLSQKDVKVFVKRFGWKPELERKPFQVQDEDPTGEDTALTLEVPAEHPLAQLAHQGERPAIVPGVAETLVGAGCVIAVRRQDGTLLHAGSPAAMAEFSLADHVMRSS